MESFKVEFYPDYCCGECNEIVHNHFNCPVCKNDNASTTISCAIWEDDNETFDCEECGTTFRFVSKNMDNNLKYEIVRDGDENVSNTV